MKYEKSKSYQNALGTITNILPSVYFDAEKNNKKLSNVNLKIGVAVSGGRDSLALLIVTKRAINSYIKKHNATIELVAIIVNHNLSSSSEKIAEEAKENCSKIGVKSEILNVTVNVEKDGYEAGARTARYDAMSEYVKLQNLDYVLLGHTSDDQFETVIFHLANLNKANLNKSNMNKANLNKANSGDANLDLHLFMNDSLLYNDVIFKRPFLSSVSRQDTTEICKIELIDFYDDPTNKYSDDDSYNSMRSLIREHITPGFKKVFGEDVCNRIAKH
ncbi:MAG: tRNA lysidine(34) synthetase TilS [Bifidobacteriaceae bacterium]|jgi:tRNA(Ile)-lysidine synthase|nr:tRNA lysidine(34) synthetase TilS [Bifidobacteriaceae bacterium]